MTPRTVHAFGIGIIIFAFIMFLIMVFAIVAWGPVALTMMVVIMGMFVGGALLMSYGATSEDVPQPGMFEKSPFCNEPEEHTGTGNGYCPGCGSPLSIGDTFCGVCGKRL